MEGIVTAVLSVAAAGLLAGAFFWIAEKKYGTEEEEAAGEIMREEQEAFREPLTAFVRCGGTCEKARNKLIYTGETDCKIVFDSPGRGEKSCEYGCIGGGTCVRVCPSGAVYLEDGIAVVDPDKCDACGKCIDNCPKHLIELRPKKSKYAVRCASKEIVTEMWHICSSGCIGCGICERNCPEDAVHVTDFLAHIDYDKCTGCGICAGKCPKQAIPMLENGTPETVK